MANGTMFATKFLVHSAPLHTPRSTKILQPWAINEYKKNRPATHQNWASPGEMRLAGARIWCGGCRRQLSGEQMTAGGGANVDPSGGEAGREGEQKATSSKAWCGRPDFPGRPDFRLKEDAWRKEGAPRNPPGSVNSLGGAAVRMEDRGQPEEGGGGAPRGGRAAEVAYGQTRREHRREVGGGERFGLKKGGRILFQKRKERESRIWGTNERQLQTAECDAAIAGASTVRFGSVF
jgi:hypothetical protein